MWTVGSACIESTAQHQVDGPASTFLWSSLENLLKVKCLDRLRHCGFNRVNGPVSRPGENAQLGSAHQNGASTCIVVEAKAMTRQPSGTVARQTIPATASNRGEDATLLHGLQGGNQRKIFVSTHKTKGEDRKMTILVIAVGIWSHFNKGRSSASAMTRSLFFPSFSTRLIILLSHRFV